MAKLGIFTVLPKNFLQISYTLNGCVITMGLSLPINLNVSIEHMYPGTRFHMDFISFKWLSCRKFSSTFTITDATEINFFG